VPYPNQHRLTYSSTPVLLGYLPSHHHHHTDINNLNNIAHRVVLFARHGYTTLKLLDYLLLYLHHHHYINVPVLLVPYPNQHRLTYSSTPVLLGYLPSHHHHHTDINNLNNIAHRVVLFARLGYTTLKLLDYLLLYLRRSHTYSQPRKLHRHCL